MISDAVEFIRKALVRHLGLTNVEVTLASARTLSDVGAPGVAISLVNLEEESALRNLPHTERRSGQLVKVEPPVFLNLYLLFSFDFTPYETALIRLGETIELFQKSRWFGPETQTGPGAVPFPPGVERLVFELQNMNFEALNNLWGILGGSYYPSVVYKVRLVKVQAADTAQTPEITTIRLDTVVSR